MRTSSGCDEASPSGKFFGRGLCCGGYVLQSPGVATFSETMPAEMPIALGFQYHSCCGVFLQKADASTTEFCYHSLLCSWHHETADGADHHIMDVTGAIPPGMVFGCTLACAVGVWKCFFPSFLLLLQKKLLCGLMKTVGNYKL